MTPFPLTLSRRVPAGPWSGVVQLVSCGPLRPNLGIALALAAAWLAHGSVGAAEFSHRSSLGVPKDFQTPWWLHDLGAVPDRHFAARTYLVTPPPGEADLALTIVFDDPEGGFVRLLWMGDVAHATLVENLSEGTGLESVRTVLVRRSTLRGPGRLTVQCSSTRMLVSEIQWDWVEPRWIPTAASLEDRPGMIGPQGAFMSDADVAGVATEAPADTVRGHVVTASLIHRTERIDDGVAVLAEIGGEPVGARLEGRFSGVALGDGIHLWINDEFVGLMTLETPNLLDASYTYRHGFPLLRGWRRGTIYIPAILLKRGENRIQFGRSDSETDEPLAVKELKLQLAYEPKDGKR